MTPNEQGAVISGSIINFAEVAPSYYGNVLPYEIIDYDDYLGGGEITVMAYDSTRAWTTRDMLMPDQVFTGQTYVEDGYGDYYVPIAGAGKYELYVPGGSQSIFAAANGTNSYGLWYVNLSDAIQFGEIGAGYVYANQDLTIPLGNNTVSGEVFFPADYEGGSTSWNSVRILIYEAGDSDDGLGRAITGSNAENIYAMENLPAGTYYVVGVADGLAQFTSQEFTLTGESSEVVDIIFDYQSDMAWDPPAEQHIQTEMGSVVPLPFELVNLGAGDPGEVEIALYASTDSIVDFGDTELTLLAPGEVYAEQWAFIAPDVAGTYYIVAVADPGDLVYESDETNNWSEAITLEAIDESQVTQFAFAGYFPLVGGMEKLLSFAMSSPNGSTSTSSVKTVVAQELVDFHGIDAVEVSKFANGRWVSSMYYVVDEGGTRIIGQSQLEGLRRTEVVFEEGVIVCPTNIHVGMVNTASTSWSGAGWSGAYNQQVTVVGFEEIVTSIGTYNALRLNFQIDATKHGDGIDVAVSDNYEAWLVDGIGVVHQGGVLTETSGDNAPRVWTFAYDLTKAPTGGQVGGDEVIDLIARFPEGYVPPAQLIPGNRIRVPVIIQNMGTDTVSTTIALDIYSSGDEFLGEGDTLLARNANVRINLAPGAGRTYYVTFTVPRHG